MSYPTSTSESTITTTLVIFDSQVTDLPLLYTALLPGSLAHTIQPNQDPIDHITHLLTQTGATKLAIVAHGQPGSIQIGNGQIDRAMLEARSGLLQEWGLDSIALYACEVGADAEFIRRFAELTGAQIAAATGKVGAGKWELDGGMELLSIDRLIDYSSTLATFTGTAGADTADASFFGSLIGFTGGTIAQLQDLIGDTFNGGDGNDSVSAGAGNDILVGSNGINNLSGNAGDDRISAGYMRDTVDGGTGNDFLSLATPISTDAYSVIFTGANAGKFKINGVDTGTFTRIEQLGFVGDSGNDVIDAALANLIVTPLGTTLGFGTYGLVINGFGGNDTVLGSANADEILGGDDNDFLYGQGGDDLISGNNGFDIIFGGSGIDTINGGSLNDTIFGQIGDDNINGDDGEDYLYGEDGNDTIKGGYGFDIIYGQAGDDTIYGEGVTVNAFGADTTIVPGAGVGINDTIFGGLGNDDIYGGIGQDYLYGEEDNDIISGSDGLDVIYGQAGNDNLSGEAGNDYLVGGDGVDELYGGDGSDQLNGEAGDDLLYGEAGDDFLYGNDGIDEIYGDGGNDVLDGGIGDDFLIGAVGNDVLFGGDGNDFLVGEFSFTDPAGVDYLYGGNGNDKLEGYAGADFLIGGAGSDTFSYYAMTDAGDTITDFDPLVGGDKLDLTYLFNTNLGVPSGSVNARYLQFVQSGTSTTVQVDPDGLGAASFVTMATLNNVTTSQLSFAPGGNVLV